MSNREITEEKLNLFVDEQLDKAEMESIRQVMLEDKSVRERVCQIKAVRELVGYAYTDVPAPRRPAKKTRFINRNWRSVAASFALVVGVVLGWTTFKYLPSSIDGITAENAFDYVANHVQADAGERRIVLHIDTGDIGVVNSALTEANHLIATYREANIPMKLDVVTNKGGINLLREDMSPYIDKIHKMITEDGVTFYACRRSVKKAHDKDGKDVKLIKGVQSDKTAADIITPRISRGWVYIKA